MRRVAERGGWSWQPRDWVASVRRPGAGASARQRAESQLPPSNAWRLALTVVAVPAARADESGCRAEAGGDAGGGCAAGARRGRRRSARSASWRRRVHRRARPPSGRRATVSASASASAGGVVPDRRGSVVAGRTARPHGPRRRCRRRCGRGSGAIALAGATASRERRDRGSSGSATGVADLAGLEGRAGDDLPVDADGRSDAGAEATNTLLAWPAAAPARWHVHQRVVRHGDRPSAAAM